MCAQFEFRYAVWNQMDIINEQLILWKSKMLLIVYILYLITNFTVSLLHHGSNFSVLINTAKSQE